jgi:hypothetical protein
MHQTFAFVDLVRRRESALHQGLGGDEVVKWRAGAQAGARCLPAPDPPPPCGCVVSRGRARLPGNFLLIRWRNCCLAIDRVVRAALDVHDRPRTCNHCNHDPRASQPHPPDRFIHLLNVQPVVDYELVEHALILELQASLLLVR